VTATNLALAKARARLSFHNRRTSYCRYGMAHSLTTGPVIAAALTIWPPTHRDPPIKLLRQIAKGIVRPTKRRHRRPYPPCAFSAMCLADSVTAYRVHHQG
jgi:hypothetical protein